MATRMGISIEPSWSCVWISNEYCVRLYRACHTDQANWRWIEIRIWRCVPCACCLPNMFSTFSAAYAFRILFTVRINSKQLCYDLWRTDYVEEQYIQYVYNTMYKLSYTCQIASVMRSRQFSSVRCVIYGLVCNCGVVYKWAQSFISTELVIRRFCSTDQQAQYSAAVSRYILFFIVFDRWPAN